MAYMNIHEYQKSLKNIFIKAENISKSVVNVRKNIEYVWQVIDWGRIQPQRSCSEKTARFCRSGIIATVNAKLRIGPVL